MAKHVDVSTFCIEWTRAQGDIPTVCKAMGMKPASAEAKAERIRNNEDSEKRIALAPAKNGTGKKAPTDYDSLRKQIAEIDAKREKTTGKPTLNES